ncbi:MAG TPA: hypothetical protein VFV73_35450 [Streptosporangiaceae bacterium]|nr:hypothetical protein [Streptosporangiaceae bacterium]
MSEPNDSADGIDGAKGGAGARRSSGSVLGERNEIPSLLPIPRARSVG